MSVLGVQAMVVPPSETVRHRASQWLRAFRWSLALLALLALAAAAESLLHDRYPKPPTLFPWASRCF